MMMCPCSVLTNKERVLRVLTNEKRVLPDISGGQGFCCEHCGHGLRGDLPGLPGGDGDHLVN